MQCVFAARLTNANGEEHISDGADISMKEEGSKVPSVAESRAGIEVNEDMRQELIQQLQRIAEVLWWGGGEPFRESVKETAAKDESLRGLSLRFLGQLA